MPVIRAPRSKNKQARVLVCDECGKRSPVYAGNSPAAPDLSACELAEPDGWAFDVGFFSMMLGHTVFCPACVKRMRARSAAVDAAD